jgi:fatty acid desaturase
VPVSALPAADAIERQHLKDSTGRSYKEFKASLKPRWIKVWLDIIAGYVVIGVTLWALARLERSMPGLVLLWIPLAALILGATIAYIQLFLHEAAHFNIAPGRRLNDFLANVFLGLMVGQEIRGYRRVHFDHHRYLGTIRDTERAYFDALDAKFIIQSLAGIKLLKILTRRAEGAQTTAEASDELGREGPGLRGRRLLLLGAGAVANLAIIAAAVVTKHWAVAVAWPLAMGSVHPFVNAMRQLVEHRSFEAVSHNDYTKVPHGPNTRMFAQGPLASVLGGAGFNRHLLHHWEPQISYTCFPDLERYLLDTPSADVFRMQKTSYLRAFGRLMRAR